MQSTRGTAWLNAIARHLGAVDGHGRPRQKLPRPPITPPAEAAPLIAETLEGNAAAPIPGD
eukprot:7820968-Pyramimonas_sp.AAC.1